MRVGRRSRLDFGLGWLGRVGRETLLEDAHRRKVERVMRLYIVQIDFWIGWKDWFEKRLVDMDERGALEQHNDEAFILLGQINSI